MRHSPFCDPADRASASFRRDVAGEIDQEADELLEAFMGSVKQMGPLRVPATVMDLHATIAQIAARALVDPHGFGAALAELRTRGIDEARQEAVLHTMALVMDGGNDPRKVAADSIAFAAGMHGLQHGRSQTELARESEVGRACISKRATIAQRALGLNPSRGMKDEDAQEAYQVRAHEVHGTAVKAIGKEAALLGAAIKRLTLWLERIAPDLQSASDGPDASGMLCELFTPLIRAMERVFAPL